MVCCCGPDAPEKASFDKEHMSPITDRKCRDIFFFLLFLVCAGGSVWISVLAVRDGDLNRLRYGISSNNDLCGTGTEVNRDKLLFCFNATDATNVASISLSNLVFTVCAASCPTTGDELVAIYNDKKAEFVAATGISTTFWEAADHLLLKSTCIAPSTSLLNRCVLDVSVNSTTVDLFLNLVGHVDPADRFLKQASQMFMNAYNDLYTTWYIILICGIIGGSVCSFVWLQLLRFFAALVVWTTITGSVLVLIAVDTLLAIKAGYAVGLDKYFPQGHGPGSFSVQPAVEKTWEDRFVIIFWIFIGFTTILMFVLIFMFNRIRLAVALIKEAADVLRKIPQILLTPLIPIAGVGLFFFYSLFIGALLASCGTIRNGTLEFDRDLRYSVFFHIFFCMWAMFAMVGAQSVVMAGTVATYYWTRDKSTISWPIFGSMYRMFRYHLGSVALGSLVLNTVKLIKWFLTYLAYRIKKLAGSNNKFFKWVVACTMCIVHCVEKFIKFLTKNAYIMIAVDGHSFCYATGQAWQLIMSNVLRMTAVNIVSAYVFFLGKIICSCLCAIAAGLWIQQALTFIDKDASVTSVFTPVLCTLILAYVTSHVFYEVVDFTIDTLLLCFCVDDQQHRETGGYFASVRLLKFMAMAPKIKRHEDAEKK